MKKVYILVLVAMIPAFGVSAEELIDGTAGVDAPGDRLSTVGVTPERIEYPLESRTLPDTEDLLPDDPVMSKKESFGETRGIHADFDGLFGTRTPADFSAAASYDAGRFSGTLRALSRSQTENTPSNLAPLVQRIEGSGHYDVSYGKYRVNAGLIRESESARSERFRSQDRRVGRAFGGIRLEASPITAWNLLAGASLDGGRYRDPGVYDRGSVDFRGDAALSGQVDEVDVTVSAETNYFTFGAEYGSLLSLGATGLWLPVDRLGVRAGAQLSSSAMPGRGSRTRLCPEVALDWAISPDSYVKLEARPRVISHSFGDLYALNGLVTPDVPMLYEDRKFDLSVEYGVKLYPKVRFTTGLFAWTSENAPVFSRTAGLFEIVPDSRLTVSGIQLGAVVDTWGRWSGDGTVTVRKTSWNHSGEVPYTPFFRLVANGRFEPRDFWALYGSLRIQGKQYVEADSDATAKAFMTVDLGAEREIVRQRCTSYVEVRNLLNANGAWWSEDYRMPGIGLYAGLRAKY